MYARMLVLVLVLCTSTFAQKGQFVAPDGAEMEKYPILLKAITPLQVAEMHLHPVKLPTPTVVENHYRDLRDKKGRFVLETLPVNTLVYQSEDGKIRYKADCSNRLVELQLVRIIPNNPTTTGSGSSSVAKPTGRWQKFNDALKSMAKWIWGGIGNFLSPFWWLLLVLLGIWLVGGLLWAIARAFGLLALRLSNGPHRDQRTAPATEPPAPKPVTPTGVPEATQQTATPSTGRRSFLSFAKAGDGNTSNMLRYQGMDVHHYERSADGVHTIRFTHHQ